MALSRRQLEMRRVLRVLIETAPYMRGNITRQPGTKHDYAYGLWKQR